MFTVYELTRHAFREVPMSLPVSYQQATTDSPQELLRLFVQYPAVKAKAAEQFWAFVYWQPPDERTAKFMCKLHRGVIHREPILLLETPEGDMSGSPDGEQEDQPSLTLSLELTQQWNGGFQGRGTVTNTGTIAVMGWKAQWNAPWSIANLWEGQHSKQGNTYTVVSLGYNSVIQPGSSVSFGFNGSGRWKEPTNLSAS